MAYFSLLLGLITTLCSPGLTIPNSSRAIFSISFGVAFGKKLAVGINIKTLFSTIAEEYKGTGIYSWVIITVLQLFYKYLIHLF